MQVLRYEDVQIVHIFGLWIPRPAIGFRFWF